MIDFLQHTSLASPWWLLLLLLLPIYFLLNRKNTSAGALPLSVLREGMKMRSWRTVIAAALPFVLATAFLAAILALARPQVVLVEERIKADGIDIFLVMDLSSSMLSKDFEPDRLTVSKALAADFVSKRPYDRVGLVSFGGEAYTQSPLTTDHKIVQTMLSELTCGILSDGTAIGMGLATAVNRLKDSEATSKVVILLTDGVNNSGYIDPKTAAAIATEYDIKVYTIGVGSMGMALTPVASNRSGQYQFSRLPVEIDDQLLEEIASSTGGEYYRAINADELEAIYAKIDELEKTEMEITVIRRVKEYFRYPLAVAIGLFMLYFLIKYMWLRIWPD